MNIDFGWKFSLGDFSRARDASFNDSSWRSLDVPHDWSIEGDYSRSNPSSVEGGYLPTGVGWYRRRFTLPLLWQQKPISIEFEAIYMNSEIFLNGTENLFVFLSQIHTLINK